MKTKMICAGVMMVATLSAALAADLPPLRGGRFKPADLQHLTPPQQALVKDILAGPRVNLNGPFNILLRSPDFGNRLQSVGEYIRFKTSLPPAINEFAILVVAREWSAQFEWYAHRKFAITAGVPATLIDSIAAEPPFAPLKLNADQQAVYNFIRELDTTKHVGDKTFDAVKTRYGERGVVDLIGLIGYYHTMSMLMNVDGYPLPPGAKSQLPPP